MKIKNHPLLKELIELKGNARSALYTEPLWIIPFGLYTPFMAVYMSALNLSDSQIGLIASITMFTRAIFALLSGAITDKLGRKVATVLFDTIAWSIPCILWALSQNFWWFVIAAALNGVMEIPSVSWTCLLVEDTDKKKIIKVYTLLHLIAQLTVIFAPIAALLVSQFSIVPVMRGIFFFSCVSMTSKFVILYLYCEETEVGKVRKKETIGVSLLKIMSGYGQVLKRVLASRSMVLALAISAIFNVTMIIMGNFFGLYVTGPLGIPDHFLAYFPIIRTVIIILFIGIILPRLNLNGFKRPMLVGIVLYVLSHVVLIVAPPEGGLIIPVIYTILEACAYSFAMPSRDSIIALLIEEDERARITSIINVLTLTFAIPFGYIAGVLSDSDRRLPFGLGIIFFIIMMIVIIVGGKYMRHKEA